MPRSTRLASLPPRIAPAKSTAPPLLEKETDPFYGTSAWRNLVNSLIALRGARCEDPKCRNPTHPGRLIGDHIKELKDGGAELDPNNVMLRCPSCHTIKTIAARKQRNHEEIR